LRAELAIHRYLSIHPHSSSVKTLGLSIRNCT
jgi:hypothetical protein